MTRVRHLVGVWNPTYEADAMDAHVRILLDAARERREGKRDDDDVYLWWGKVRSSNRQRPLPHLKDILAIDDVLAAESARLALSEMSSHTDEDGFRSVS